MSLAKALTVKNNVDEDLMSALRSSLYPGIEDKYINMVIEYCRAHKIDPLLKPVHLVEIWSSKEKRKVMTVMPGINLYRVKADMTGAYAGLTEPEFGPMIEAKVGTVTVRYPEWCKIAVKRIVQGKVCKFWGFEFWDENYAQKRGDDETPNSMWEKRRRGQLAKCTEAQALRKAFPGIVPSTPTYEEMQGKQMYGAGGKSLNAVKSIDHDDSDYDKSITITPTTSALLSLINEYKIPSESTNKWLKKFNVRSIYDLSDETKAKIIDKIKEREQKELTNVEHS